MNATTCEKCGQSSQVCACSADFDPEAAAREAVKHEFGNLCGLALSQYSGVVDDLARARAATDAALDRYGRYMKARSIIMGIEEAAKLISPIHATELGTLQAIGVVLAEAREELAAAEQAIRESIA